MLLFHRTSIANARQIVQNGFADDKWSFGERDVGKGEDLKKLGVWLTDRALSSEEGPQGDAVVEIDLDLSEESLFPFELTGMFVDARLFVIPSELVNPHSTMRIGQVDPRTSWWHEAQQRPDDS